MFVHTCTYIYICVHMFTYIDTWYIYIYFQIFTHISIYFTFHSHMFTYTYVYLHVFTYECISMYIYICIYLLIYIFIYCTHSLLIFQIWVIYASPCPELVFNSIQKIPLEASTYTEPSSNRCSNCYRFM